MKIFLHYIKEEVLQLMTLERKNMLLMLGVLVVYSLLFGCLFAQHTVTQVPVAVCNLDQGVHGRAIVRMLYENHDIKVVRELATVAEAEEMVSGSEVYGVAVIPEDFSEQLATGQTTSVLGLVNNANTVLGASVMNGLQQVVGTYNGEMVVQQRLSNGWSFAQANKDASAIQLSTRSLYNSTGGYVDFFLPLLVVHALQIGVVFVMGPMVCLQKQGWRRELFTNSKAFLAAKILVYAVLEAVVLVLMLLACGVLFDMQVQLSLSLAWTALGFAAVVTALGVAAGVLVSNPSRCISYTLFYIMPSVLFTGALWPRSSMDSFSWLLSYLVPIGYSADAVRDLLQRGAAPELLTGSIGLIVQLLFFYSLALYGMQRLAKEKNYAGSNIA